MANYWYVLFFSLVGGVFSLAGGALLLSNRKTADALAKYAAPFAAGALLAAAFFELLPESAALKGLESTGRWAVAGIVIFFLLEHFLHWFHHHRQHEDKKKVREAAPLIIIGDTLHNLLDGIAIGAAFLIDVPTGVVAALAVAAHEIPQEIGDFGILLKSGIARPKVMFINALSALASTLGALTTFWLGSQSELPLGALLALTAGLFIYIAASDLIPDIHESAAKKTSIWAAALLIAGVITVGVSTELAHRYFDAGHAQGTEEHAEDDHEEAH